MKILVTGGTGFIGSHTALALARAGHEVRLFVRDPEKARRVFSALGADTPETVTGDVTDEADVGRALSGCDAVFHAAAVVAFAGGRAGEMERINQRAVELVVGGAHARGLAPIVYVSSLAAIFHPEGGPMGPDTPPVEDAENAYGRSKARCERWIRERQAEGVPVAATYPSGVLGPDAPSLGELHRSLPLQLRAAMVTSTGLNLVDVRDLAIIHTALFARAPAPGRWIAAGPYLSWREMADLLREVTGRRIPRLPVPGAMLRGVGWLLDRLAGRIDLDVPITHEGMTFATRWPGADSGATVRELGVDFRDPGETLADTLRWMARAGHVEPARVGRLAEDAGA